MVFSVAVCVLRVLLNHPVVQLSLRLSLRARPCEYLVKLSVASRTPTVHVSHRVCVCVCVCVCARACSTTACCVNILIFFPLQTIKPSRVSVRVTCSFSIPLQTIKPSRVSVRVPCSFSILIKSSVLCRTVVFSSDDPAHLFKHVCVNSFSSGDKSSV